MDQMGSCFDRLRCEAFQNLFLSPMNTDFVRPAVATVLTVYGIETHEDIHHELILFVATVLTVYGIETVKLIANSYCITQLQQYLPFTVLKRDKITKITIIRFSCNSTYRLRY